MRVQDGGQAERPRHDHRHGERPPDHGKRAISSLQRLREGQNVRIAVTNTLKEDTSIHWHGLLVPFQMDGVPGVSFPGIKPGETFTYEFPIIQSGTYWYHSHSGLQEQEGHYGPMIIDPKGVDPVQADREHVIVLSDYSFMHPHLIFKRMKQQCGVFNSQRQTVAGLLAGKDQSLAERIEWAKMLMDPTDISDVTGVAYKFLINGHGPQLVFQRALHPKVERQHHGRIRGCLSADVAVESIFRPTDPAVIKLRHADIVRAGFRQWVATHTPRIEGYTGQTVAQQTCAFALGQPLHKQGWLFTGKGAIQSLPRQ